MARGRAGRIRSVLGRIERQIVGGQDRWEIVRKTQGLHWKRKERLEGYVEGERKDQVAWECGREEEQKAIESKKAETGERA